MCIHRYTSREVGTSRKQNILVCSMKQIRLFDSSLGQVKRSYIQLGLYKKCLYKEIQRICNTKNLQCLDNYFREMSRLVSVNYNNIYEEVDVHVSLSFQYHKIILTDIRYQQLFLFLFRNNCHHNSDVNAQT